MLTRKTLATVLVGAATLMGAAILSTAREADVSRAGRPPESRRVVVAGVEDLGGDRVIRFPGTTRAVERASVPFLVGGRLTSRPVEIGDRVRAGQVLATLDLRELENIEKAAEASLAELEARAAQSRRERSRVERLAQEKAATDEEMERAVSEAEAIESARSGAESRLAEARRRRDEGVVTAPYAATVIAVHAEPGEAVAAGDPVVELAGDGAVEIEIGLPESWIGRLRDGDAVRVEYPFRKSAGDPARVTGIGRAAGAGRLFPVIVTLDRPSPAVPGMAAEVVLPFRGEGERSVPLAAVLNPGGSRPNVFRVEGNVARRVPVEIVSLAGDRVVVTGTLAPGDAVVVAGHLALVDGDRVEVAR